MIIMRKEAEQTEENWITQPGNYHDAQRGKIQRYSVLFNVVPIFPRISDPYSMKQN